MAGSISHPKIYDGEGDRLIDETHLADRIVLLPDARPSKVPDPTPRLRIMWGQHLLDDVLAGRYHSLICAVNSENNDHGIICQLAELIPTSQWDKASITENAKQFSAGDHVKVIKYDMDMIEVLAVMRPTNSDHLTLAELGKAFTVVTEMVKRKPQRLPSASVSFLGARSNLVIDESGEEPSFEAVLRMMYQAGYTGDVYPAPGMWDCAPTSVYARYPFPSAVESMREGGF